MRSSTSKIWSPDAGEAGSIQGVGGFVGEGGGFGATGALVRCAEVAGTVARRPGSPELPGGNEAWAPGAATVPYLDSDITSLS
jgi:hypothetical protein